MTTYPETSWKGSPVGNRWTCYKVGFSATITLDTEGEYTASVNTRNLGVFPALALAKNACVTEERKRIDLRISQAKEILQQYDAAEEMSMKSGVVAGTIAASIVAFVFVFVLAIAGGVELAQRTTEWRIDNEQRTDAFRCYLFTKMDKWPELSIENQITILRGKDKLERCQAIIMQGTEK